MRRRETLALVKMTTNTHVSPRLPERQPLLLLILMLILVEPSVAAGGLDVQVAAATKEGAQVVHLPDEPAKLTTTTTTTTTISTTVDTTPYRCLEDSEFSCSSERRCIPKSWRCDFTEQCLAGEDEFGCLPERCHFERDLCNWQNEPPTAHNKLPLQQAWRRYRRVSGALLSRQQPQSLVSCGADCSPAAPPPTTTVTSPSPIEVIEQRKLARLELLATVSSATTTAAAAGQPGTADTGADYLYVPLSLGGAKLSSGRPPAATNTANQQQQQQQQHNHVLSLSSESTRFRAPLISQTDSRCQLSFGYALWTTAILGSLGISPPPRSSQHKLQLSLHLYLHLHQLHKATNSSNLPPDPIWLSKHLSVYPQSDQTIGGETSESDWHLARLDIGHVRDAQLSFEAHLTLAPISGGSRRTLVSSSSSELGDDWAVSGLVALRALEFRNCAWPQGVQPAVQLLQPIADDETPGQSDSTTCSRSDQFRCPSGVCLDKERLCDHLRDCLPDGADEAAHLCSQVPGMEDFESSGSATPGWWTQPEPASAEASFWTIGGSWPTDRLSVQSGPTWAAPHLPRRDHTSLGGSGDSASGAGGHYLSLDLTTTATTLSGGADDSAAPQRHWLYLNSAPLRWKSPTASRNQQRADCRLKLFYNLVAADGHWPQASVPFKIYIALEHFVLSAHPDRRQRAVLARKLHFLLHSHVESIGPNELDDSSGSGSSSSSSNNNNNNSNDMSASAAIEAPGVDFWREINHKLVVADDEIKPEELFYARLVVIVEPIKQLQLQFQQHQQSQQQLALTTNTMKQAQPFRATLNIDDLSTHFGCEAVDSSSSRGSTSTAAAYSASQQRWYLNSSFDRNDYFQTKQQANLLRFYPPISKRSQRHYSQQLSSTRQFEPHKLVICVVAVLSSIAGLIIIIVFIIVPYVERIAISYHDQLAANQSFVGSSAGLISSSHARPGIDIVTNSSSNHQNNNTTDSDWEQVSKRWRRSTINGIISSESELSVLDSLAGNRQQNLQQQQQSSANSSSPVSSHLTHNDCSSSSLASGTSSSSSSSSSSSADNSTVYCGTNSTSAV